MINIKRVHDPTHSELRIQPRANFYLFSLIFFIIFSQVVESKQAKCEYHGVDFVNATIKFFTSEIPEILFSVSIR